MVILIPLTALMDSITNVHDHIKPHILSLKYRMLWSNIYSTTPLAPSLLSLVSLGLHSTLEIEKTLH
jgi:hypothetical protein